MNGYKLMAIDFSLNINRFKLKNWVLSDLEIMPNKF